MGIGIWHTIGLSLHPLLATGRRWIQDRRHYHPDIVLPHCLAFDHPFGFLVEGDLQDQVRQRLADPAGSGSYRNFGSSF